jgi:hypothetical protein
MQAVIQHQKSATAAREGARNRPGEWGEAVSLSGLLRHYPKRGIVRSTWTAGKYLCWEIVADEAD